MRPDMIVVGEVKGAEASTILGLWFTHGLGERLVVRVCAIGSRIFNERYTKTRKGVEDIVTRQGVLVEDGLVEVFGQVLSQAPEGFGHPASSTSVTDMLR